MNLEVILTIYFVSICVIHCLHLCDLMHDLNYAFVPAEVDEVALPMLVEIWLPKLV